MVDQVKCLPVVKKNYTGGIPSSVGGLCPGMDGILMSAWVAEERGIPPNWEGLITRKMAGATCFSTMKSSASFDMAVVSEIGLRCLLMSRTGFSFGIDVMLARFHTFNSSDFELYGPYLTRNTYTIFAIGKGKTL